MSYRKSNDNWQQMLLKLDALGVKPWFIYKAVTLLPVEELEYYRTDLRMSGLNPVALFTAVLHNFMVHGEDCWDAGERIYFKLLSMR